MAITTRQTTSLGVTNKGAPLTNAELDENFIYLYNGNVRTLNVETNVTLGSTTDHRIVLNGLVDSDLVATGTSRSIHQFTINGNENDISVKHSSVSGLTYGSGDLNDGELFLNSVDRKLYFKDGVNVTHVNAYNSSKLNNVISQGIGGANAQQASIWKTKSVSEVLDEILFPSIPRAIDPRWGPYNSVLEALVGIDQSQRYHGLTVGIRSGGEIVEYWFKAGVNDVDLILKTVEGLTGDYIPSDEKGIANGVATLDNASKIPTSQLPNVYVPLTSRGQPDGVASLDATGKIPTTQLPSGAIIANYLGAPADETEMLLLSGAEGDWCVRVDLGTTWVIVGPDQTQLSNWKELAYPSVPVISINGQTGSINLEAIDVGAIGETSLTGSAKIPVGSSAQRDTSPLTGYFRFNTDLGLFEGYNGSSWGAIAGGGSSTLSDTTVSGTFYPTFANTTSGSFSTAYISSNKLSFSPSSGTLNAVIFNSLSDEQAKTDVTIIEKAIDKLEHINGVSFEWKATGEKGIGVIAQNLETVFPELVKLNEESGLKSVNYDGLVGVLIQAIKELNIKVNELESQIKVSGE